MRTKEMIWWNSQLFFWGGGGPVPYCAKYLLYAALLYDDGTITTMCIVPRLWVFFQHIYLIVELAKKSC